MTRAGWAPKHLPEITYSRRLRDLFVKSYWVRCWECDFALGPFPNRAIAELFRELVDSGEWRTE